MVAFGLFLLLGVGIVAGFALAAGDDPAVLNLLGFELDTTDRTVFVTGALCTLGLLLSLRVIAVGWRRGRRRRRELRELRSSAAHTTTQLPEPDAQQGRRHGHRRPGSEDDWDERHFESAPHD